MTAIATRVNIAAEIFPTLSPKLRRPILRPARTTVKLSHDKNVRLVSRRGGNDQFDNCEDIEAGQYY